ncbi:hypothetical protein [Streptomyces sp. SID9727]|uniref:hypothetical protein n=1 Tax=Streptomyces sp. SID9727 TaxID=2706114 RepID=UPI001942AFB7|nr:hypothetical protein [Streptomyces sp. SID9727]
MRRDERPPAAVGIVREAATMIRTSAHPLRVRQEAPAGAGALLPREAGGVATTWDGRGRRSGDATVVAGDGLAHEAVLSRPAAVRSAGGAMAR